MRIWRLLTPDAVSPEVTAISPHGLRHNGIRALIIDLDNTLSRWNEAACEPRVACWLQALSAAAIRVCIVSNNGPERVRAFCAGLDPSPPWIANAGKPGRAAYRRALQRLDADPAEVAVVGDQVFTDILGGNRAGLLTILVRPLGRREFPVTRLVRLVEGLWLERLRASGTLRPL